MLSLALSALLTISPLLFQQSAEVAAKFDRAVEFQRRDQLEQAAEEYRGLLTIAPNYAEAQANYGAVLSRLGRYEEAVRAYQAALSLNARLTPVMFNLGIAHYRAGEFAKAAEILKQFVVISPDNSQAHRLLGISLVELGRESEAVEHLQPAMAEASDDVTVLYYLGLAYLRLQRAERDEVIQRLARSGEGKPLAKMLQGQLDLEHFEFDVAAHRLEEAAALNPDLPRLQGLLALAYLKLGRTKEAIVCFERELSRAPDDFFVLYYLGYAQDKLGNLNVAKSRVEAALRVKPESAEANALYGKILFRQGQAKAALAPIEKVVKQRPLDSETRYLRARIYQRLGRAEDAKREFAEVDRLKSQERNGENAKPKDQ